MKENQFSEEQILDNNENSPLFDEFLQLLGDKSRLRGFDKYKGGLDTVHDLTGNCFPKPKGRRCTGFLIEDNTPIVLTP